MIRRLYCHYSVKNELVLFNRLCFATPEGGKVDPGEGTKAAVLGIVGGSGFKSKARSVSKCLCAGNYFPLDEGQSISPQVALAKQQAWRKKIKPCCIITTSFSQSSRREKHPSKQNSGEPSLPTAGSAPRAAPETQPEPRASGPARKKF